MHVRSARAAGAAADRSAELGREEHSVAPVSDGAPEKFLALCSAVDIGRVEQRDAGIDGRVDDLLRRRLVDASAEVIAPQADDRRVKRTNRACLHADQHALRVAPVSGDGGFS